MPSKDPSGYARHAILCFQVAWDWGAQWFLPPWDSEEHGSARSQDCRKALFFSPKLVLHASLKMVQNPSVSSSLPSLYFLPCLTWSCSWDSASCCSDRCETGLGAIRGRWIRPAGRDLRAGMHLPHWDPLGLLQSPVGEDRREHTPLPTSGSVSRDHMKERINFMQSTLSFGKHVWHSYS